MRWIACALVLGLMQVALAQTTWLPLSREVERSYGSIYDLGSAVHTAVRPYRRSELLPLLPKDSLARAAVRPASAWAALDRWAGVNNGRTFRWGPLLDAQAMADMDTAVNNFGHRASAGFWLENEFSDRLSFQFNAQGWSERLPTYLDTLADATQVTPGEGYADGDANARTHYDWGGALSWDPGKYFNLTLGRGKNFFGEGHRSLLLSDEAYSYPYLKVTTTVWKIKYVNLFSAMNDIRGAGGDVTEFNRKYASMHYLSWNAHDRINVALFEAVIWSQGDTIYPRGFDINYLNPIIFYRPVEYSFGSPDNALLGGAINVKVGKRALIYTQLMLDEFLLDEVRSGNGWWGNKQAFQLGVVSRNAFKLPGLTLRAEWNVVRPFMYTHSDTRQNYSHLGQPLAHPYGSNLQEVIVHAERSHQRWRYGLRASMAWMGQDTSFSYGNNIFRTENERPRFPNGDPVQYGYRIGMIQGYSLLHAQLRAGYLLDANTGTRLEASYLVRVRTPETGPTALAHVFRLGVVCYFRDSHPEQEVRYQLRR